MFGLGELTFKNALGETGFVGEVWEIFHFAWGELLIFDPKFSHTLFEKFCELNRRILFNWWHQWQAWTSSQFRDIYEDRIVLTPWLIESLFEMPGEKIWGYWPWMTLWKQILFSYLGVEARIDLHNTRVSRYSFTHDSINCWLTIFPLPWNCLKDFYPLLLLSW